MTIPLPNASASGAGGQGSFSSELFDSFSDVPAEWHKLCGSDDLAMDGRVLDVFQRTLSDQCRCWGLIVYDVEGVAAGCAALCYFPTEMIESKRRVIQRGRDGIRRFWPEFGRMGVVFCGLPVPSGATHIRIREGVSAQKVVAEVDRVMQRLARKTKARLTVFKELDESNLSLTQAIMLQHYVRGSIPSMHELQHRPFKHFADYCAALKNRYRAQILRSQKKLQTAGFEMLHGRGNAFFAEHFNEEVHRLYVEVQRRAEQKLELMPIAFFTELAAALGEEVSLTLLRRNGRICAFTFAITRGPTHYNLYSGLDYALNHEGDLYFNLFYHDMDKAFRAGAASLHLGQTSDAFKSRLGTTAVKLYFFTRARSPLLHAVLRRIAPMVFPKAPPVTPHDVFTQAQPRIKAAKPGAAA